MNFIIALKLFFSIIISFLITFYLVPLVMSFAIRLKVLDVPDGKIKNHAKATPYLGGIAVYIGFLVSLALVYPFENQILQFIVGTTLLLFVGLIDDLLCIKPYQKFFGQSVAALCFLKAGFHLKELFFLSNYWTIPISFFWILSVVNAFNLVDVMDGLATTLAMTATTAFIIIALLFGHYNITLLLGAFLGALMAFFYYNKPTAQIYLGDAGSLFIGGLLATVPFLFNWSVYNGYGFLTPAVILSIPLLEVTFLIIIRTYYGIPFYQGSPHHFCLYLKRNGWSTWEILLYCTILSFLLMNIGLAFSYNHISLLHLVLMGGIFLLGWLFMLSYKRKSSLLSH